MTKQAYLTDFPLHMFASAKRRFQAAIRANQTSLIRSSLSGYAVLFDEILPSSFLPSIDPTKRQRHYGHIRVFWAWLAQILEAKTAPASARSAMFKTGHEAADFPFHPATARCAFAWKFPSFKPSMRGSQRNSPHVLVKMISGTD